MPTPDASQFTQKTRYVAISTRGNPGIAKKVSTQLFVKVPVSTVATSVKVLPSLTVKTTTVKLAPVVTGKK